MAEPRVEVETRIETKTEEKLAFEQAISASSLNPRVWTGAFSTNVWGGRYQIEAGLGEGAQGSTFVGTDLKTGAKVAVKVLDLGKARDFKPLELFERETRALKDLDHRGLPKFMDVIEDEETGARALVMTRIPGENYEHVVRDHGPLGEPALWRLLVDASAVLGALHSASSPLVHRDVKPANLIRKPDGSLGVVDLGGIGYAKSGEGSTVVGTFGYMAPEQLYGKSTPATDLYALGATVLTLATGVEPEDQPREGLAIDVNKAAPRLSEPMRALLTRLLSPEPADRPADARALRQELDALAGTKRAKGKKVRVKAQARRVNPATDHDIVFERVSGALQFALALFGMLISVGLGQVVLPVAFAIAKAFSDKKGKRTLVEMDAAVALATHSAQEKLREQMAEGQARMQGKPLPPRIEKP
jgi:hypothetical protein